MIHNSPLFSMYRSLAQHSAEVQKVSAENIARASEPGYKAKAVEPFSEFVARMSVENAASMEQPAFRVFEPDLPGAPNGNTVNLETEALNSAQAAGQYSMAMSVYGKSIEILKLAIGRGR